MTLDAASARGRVDKEYLARMTQLLVDIPSPTGSEAEVARAYGAEVTPHPFLFDHDRRLIFQGKPDDNYRDPARVRVSYLRDAIEAALAGRPVPLPVTSVIGCSVKWKS